MGQVYGKESLMKTILIVDDEEAFRRGLSMGLTMEGYGILEAKDGLEGSEMAAKHLPDLIITDVQMDNMNGFVMLEELRRNEATSLIPAILMTGASVNAGAWQAGGAVEYLEKPFSLDDLVAAVKKILG